MTTITITGMKPLLRKLDTVQDVTATLGPPMHRALGHLHRRVARYPRKDPTAFARLATPRQKRAYWARVRSGAITHGSGGYVRTGTLGRKWTSRVQTGRAFIRGTLGNNAGYGIYVQGGRRQSFHRASGWETTDDVAQREARAVQAYFDAAINQALHRG